MSRRVRFARAMLVLVSSLTLSAAVTGPGPAAAEPYPAPEPPDPSYVLSNFLTLFQGTVHDLNNPAMLDYFVKASILTNTGRLTSQFEELTRPEIYQTSDGQSKVLAGAQKLWDTLLHTPPLRLGFAPHPDYLPDWNHDGKFGLADTAGVTLIPASADAMVDDNYYDPAYQQAQYRFPCLQPDGAVLYETTDGDCAAGDSGADFKFGIVEKVKIVDSRGIPLVGKVWLPADFDASSEKKYPVTMGMPGAAESQEQVAMYAQSAARAGYLTFTFAQAGQPGSDGNALDLVLPLGSVEDCFAPGSCRDAQDIVRWIFGQDITPVVDLANEAANVLAGQNPRLVRSNPAYEPVGNNPRNQWIDKLDLEHVNLWGQSVGSIGVTNYLNWQDKGFGIDGRPLPHVSSVVGMSGFAATTAASAPLQMQTADFDIPGLSGYGITNFYQPFFNPTDGPYGTKDRYDNLLRSGRSQAMQVIAYEGGSHGDSVNWVAIPRNLRSPALSVHYYLDWFDCYGKADSSASACQSLSEPVKGLSRAVATEYAPQGSAGPSLCVTVPDRASLAQILRPEVFLYNLNNSPAKYDCQPQR
ncbi:hypothetical protein [Nocardia concava]|uniref:hypothetical protein n=1 Tax=Nocardia concava TaxID=257281 RepID=UPI00031F4CE0|nr:hypothetical protein [Nocardia concava]